MSKPSKQEAIDCVKTLLAYIGVDQKSQHIDGTAERVIRSFEELYAGYQKTASQVIGGKFYDIKEQQEMVLLKNIEFNSTCAHHMLPIIGHASVAYIPNAKVVGISKIAKVVELFARRLQIQEDMTAEIANALHEHLEPAGVAVKVSATHYCMAGRGVQQRHTLMDTYFFTGVFKNQEQPKSQFISYLK